MRNNSFTIYNASAGSGKTYTLVKQYLKTVLKSNFNNYFKYILAITFTNKAVAEMKNRILDALQEFSNKDIINYPSPLFTELASELNITPEKLQQKSTKVYNAIINNYAAFDVVTIDTFTHRIIRTFAFDLKIPQNFEVALDTEEILSQAVNNLIDKIGTDKELTNTLLNYTLQKTDDDKSWDISLDLNKTAKLLLNENDIYNLDLLKNKSLSDFDNLNKLITQKINSNETELQSTVSDLLDLFKHNGITKQAFSGGHLFNYFNNLKEKKYPKNFDAAWQKKLVNNEPLYSKKTESFMAEWVDSNQQHIADTFIKTKVLYYELSFLDNFKKHLIPLSVLNLIYKELELLKEDQNIVLISEFNRIIASEIKGQPAPFIYERIGERYQNYFIDEFQDTSIMQWENLIPLTENALINEAETNNQHSLLLVGDAKQSIYRWRGGKPEQFISLYEGNTPFYIKSNVKNLDTNYRSYSEVIAFNNEFFSYLANYFSNSTHQDLYQIGNQQKSNSKKGGYVNINFIDNLKSEEASSAYQLKTLETINEVLELGFEKKDICIITRKKADGISLADYLTENGIEITSSETLLLNKNEEINFIINLLHFLIQPNNKTHQIDILFFLYNHLQIREEEHSFYQKFISFSIDDFFINLCNDYKIIFNYEQTRTLPLYELIESIIRSFNLIETNSSNAYLQYFLDEVHTFSTRKTSGIIGFIEYWNQNNHKLSIVAPENNNAVTIMTIHKSKGLEFPVIIFPFADLDIYQEIEPKVWLPIKAEEYLGFDKAYIGFNKNTQNYSDAGLLLSQEKNTQLELDNTNLLYVALTRAKEQLYIISKKSIDNNGNVKENTYSGFFINYLKNKHYWNEEKKQYEFGQPIKLSKKTITQTSNQLPYISSSRKEHNLSIITKSGYLWDSEQEKAIERGNLIHHLLSKITYQHDIDYAFNECISEGVISSSQMDEIKPIITQLVTKSSASEYFTNKYGVYTEKEIITPNGSILIPDRIVYINKTAIIIDYKTGQPNQKHKDQINTYANALSSMGFYVDKKILIYLENNIEIKEVN
ncbi:UvrD-helicase domain-containing protein [Pseudofulvibacter geojedonensis]|uniref:DNA 3'-5' helicase n=1 Tax=Pseudofulvibacter geojedonensis TaxID=1123758 RepID=A0ABW3I677_9FLAO